MIAVAFGWLAANTHCCRCEIISDLQAFKDVVQTHVGAIFIE
jgi:hypothetical protein